MQRSDYYTKAKLKFSVFYVAVISWWRWNCCGEWAVTSREVSALPTQSVRFVRRPARASAKWTWPRSACRRRQLAPCPRRGRRCRVAVGRRRSSARRSRVPVRDETTSTTTTMTTGHNRRRWAAETRRVDGDSTVAAAAVVVDEDDVADAGDDTVNDCSVLLPLTDETTRDRSATKTTSQPARCKLPPILATFQHNRRPGGSTGSLAPGLSK